MVTEQGAEPTWQATEPDMDTAVTEREQAATHIEAARVHSGEGPADTPEWDFETPTAANPIVDTGAGFVPPIPVDEDQVCEHCGGRMPNDHELLMQVLEWVAPIGPQATHAFYERLFGYAPNLRELFPTRIEVQEEKLLSAIVALLQNFQAGEAQMDALDSKLASFGRSHLRFDPAATIEEYAVVWRCLAEVLTEALGARLTDRHVNVLRRAYEYAAGKMMASQATARLAGRGRRRRTT